MAAGKCENCKFFLPDEPNPCGHCVRFPPAYHLPEANGGDGDGADGNSVRAPHYPIVKKTAWCGEFVEG